MFDRVRSHISVIVSGHALSYYREAIRRRIARWRVCMSRDNQIVFRFYDELKAILRVHDDLNLKVYLHGLDSTLVKTLENYLRPGMIVVDVGAHTGLYSLVCASLVGEEGKVYAFEPVPWLADRIIEHAALNSMSNIYVYKIALGARSGVKKLFLSKVEGEGWSSLYRWRWTSDEYILVNVTSLDEWICKQGIGRIDLLKVDVEGAEFDVLLGAQEALSQGIIRAAIVEFNEQTRKCAGFSVHEILQLLSCNGFMWYHTPWSPRWPLPVNLSRIGQQCDLFAIRNDRSVMSCERHNT